MTFDAAELRDLEIAIGDRIYLQIANWRLFLGDAGLAKDFAIECSANFHQGSRVAAKVALESFKVPVAGGKTFLPLVSLVPSAQLQELEEILNPYCR